MLLISTVLISIYVSLYWWSYSIKRKFKNFAFHSFVQSKKKQRHIQFEVFETCLKWVVYINTMFSSSYRLDRNGKLLCILITVVHFKGRSWSSKTVYCISCLIVCKIVFCSKFPDIPDNAGRKREEEEEKEEHKKLQSVMLFTQTQ